MNAMQAHLAKNQLEEAGIRCVLADEVMVSMYWHLSNAMGGIKLQVAEEDLERAAGVLDALEQKRRDGDADDDQSAASERQAQAADDEPLAESKVGDPDDEEEPRLNEREQNVERAYRATLVGFMLLPVQFYATWLLLSVWQADDPIRPALRRKLRWAIALNIPLVLLATVVVLVVMRFHLDEMVG
ncbi:putative signal transducing protein [Anatilimnocola aggregata]|nr:DUF2007 domain-containing protein [Anatilimnocola aggregata]